MRPRLYRLLGLPKGYWVPLTAVLVLKPEFHDTFARGISRIAGTLLGGGVATLITYMVAPGPHGLTALVLCCVWSGYALVRTSYALFTICITGYVVFLLMLAGLPELTAVTYRVEDTIAGGLLALCIYGLWPTWTGTEARGALAALLEAHSRYVEALLVAYADPRHADLQALGEIRAAGRLKRSNAEAIVERMLAEPAARHSIAAPVALGLLAAIRRHALASLALHAGLEGGVAQPVRGIEELSKQMAASFDGARHSAQIGHSSSGTPAAAADAARVECRHQRPGPRRNGLDGRQPEHDCFAARPQLRPGPRGTGAVTVLAVSDLRKSYGAVTAVDGLSFAVARGEILGLLGPNGAGKTTTINMLLGVLEPSAGSIRIDGFDLATHRAAALMRTNFAAVYAPLPGNLTVSENLRFFGMLYGVRG